MYICIICKERVFYDEEEPDEREVDAEGETDYEDEGGDDDEG